MFEHVLAPGSVGVLNRPANLPDWLYQVSSWLAMDRARAGADDADGAGASQRWTPAPAAQGLTVAGSPARTLPAGGARQSPVPRSLTWPPETSHCCWPEPSQGSSRKSARALAWPLPALRHRASILIVVSG